MSVIGSNILAGASGQQGYNISRSVRLRSSASAYFNRTFGSPTSGNIFTWSGWVKRGAIGAVQPLFTPSYAGGEGAVFNASNQISIAVNGALLLVSTAVYRDPSAWYHIMLVSDMGNATASLRFRVYVNGVEVTAWGTDARASYSSFPYWNKNTVVHYMGYSNAYPAYADGYMTEVNFIDGQALTPSSFGENDTITGVWKPKKYAGTYGTNGFYLNFSDNSNNTATTIGKDYSGNGNNWTPNNISVTAGVTYDSMIDTPTPYADGGTGRGNYCVVNPLKKSSSATITDGNLTVAINVVGGEQPASFAVSSGKWYWEVTPNAVYSAPGILLTSRTPSASSIASDYHYYGSNGQFYTNTSGVAYGATFGNGDVIGVALDLDSNQITFYKNGTSQGAKTIVAGEYNPDLAGATTVTNYANFGQRPFTYTPPSGFVALNTQNLPEPTIKKGNQYFNTVLYTGNAGNQSITGVGFQPDLVWGKLRSTSGNHRLHDSLRGSDNTLSSNLTDAEVSGNGLVSFDADGFTMDSGTNINQAYTYVAWNWKAGGSSSSNTSGSITSTVSVNATAGFSIVTYTGAGGNSTVGHGLGVAPSMIIIKQRSGANDWPVYHASLGNTGGVYLDLTNAFGASAAFWNNTSPTSTVFTVGNSSDKNGSGQTYVAYCFSAVRGYSAFGSYTGNGSSDGPFVFCGFRPRLVMIKKTNATSNWSILDTARDDFNVADNPLLPNTSGAETTSTSTSGAFADVLSNGFKLRGNSGDINDSGATYIYAAFSETAFKFSLAR